jgi:ferric-dicitrate binding protein FerR (iron transport regulator)
MRKVLVTCLSLFSVMALGACTTDLGSAIPPNSVSDQPISQTPHVQVAHVAAIYGGAAFVGGAPANVNQPIFFGDHFSTGAGTKMVVALESGGTITLDENVDPTLLQTVKCVVLNFFTGRLAVDASNQCVDSGGSRVYQGSYVVYEAIPSSGSLIVTVIRGHVQTVRPPGYSINAGEQLVLRRGQAVGVPHTLDPAVLNRTMSWVPVTVL